MISQTFFNPLRDAINTMRLAEVKATLVKCRTDYANWLRDEQLLTGQELKAKAVVKMSTHSVIESRDENDLTVLMYACLLYHSKARANDRMACRALDQIVAWLMEEGATLWAQGRREMVRAGTHNGRPIYIRGEGKSIVQALGQRNLPPCVQKYISELNSEVYDRFAHRIRA